MRIQGTGQLGSKTVVKVVEGDNELTLLVERVLEVHALRFGSDCALDGSLGLRSGGLSEEKAGVFHAFRAAQLENTTAITNSERLIADVNGERNALVGISGSSRDGGNFGLEVTSSGDSISSFDLDGVSGGLLHEVGELEGLHLVLTEGTLEGKRSLGSRSSSLQVELVLEVTEYGVLQDQVALGLTDHQGSEADLELSGFSRLESEFIRGHFDVLVGDGELRLVDDYLLVGRVLNHNTLRYAFTDGAEQVNGLGVFGFYDSHVDLVHNVLTRGLYLEAASELVNSSTHGHEVKLVVLGASTTDIEHFSTAFE